MRHSRPAFALALGAVALSGSVALAAEAPKTTTTSKTLYLAQEGCGATAEAGRLETKAGVDGATGCGTIGGVPLQEAFSQLGASELEDFTSTTSLKPFKVDQSKKVTGQVAAGSWVGEGGVGQVAWDIALTAVTSSGKTVDFGTQTVTATVSNPATPVVTAPFEFATPADAKGQTFKSITFSYVLHGANAGYSAAQYDGQFYVVIPAKAK